MTLPRANIYWWWVVGFVAVELMSWLVYTGPRSEMMVTGLLSVALIGMAWKRPVWLAYASIAELVVGSKGYLLFLQLGHIEISLRMIIFTLVMLTALPVIIQQWKSLRQKVLSIPFLLFVVWLVVAVLIALVRHVPITSIYSDANAFLFLALLPAWWVFIRRDADWRQNILAVVLAGATVIGLKSWLMVLLFGQDIHSIAHIYKWIRNTGVGEITLINANVYRVFFQSQIYSLLALCVSLVLFVRQPPRRWLYVPLALSALGVYISLSRSFWLGLTVALLLWIGWMIKQKSWKALGRLGILVPLAIFAWAMMIWALSFPNFDLSGGRANAVVSRLNGTDASAAATSRTNQIRPLFKSIADHPVIGSGFGTTVTYLSTDPRTKGLRTTAAFELGYLDLWLKIGLVGLILYAVWILKLWQKISITLWNGIFIVSGIALIVVHLTSPYLNHPLGLGWLMLTSLYAYDPG